MVPGVEAYSVEGTPADSVILALGTPVGEGTGLVVSGINKGPNLGDDVFISGTVGAALQGYSHGLPSVALSVAALEDAHFEVAANLGRALARRIVSNSSPRGALLNINLPNLPRSEIKDIKITRLAQRGHKDSIKEGHDGRRKYYWIMYERARCNIEEGTDIWALGKGTISITPLDNILPGTPEPSFLKDLCPSLFQELCLGE
jgi:5'-nucleotidase